MWETDTKYCFVHMSKQNERNVRKNGLHCVSLRRTLCAQKNSKQTDFADGFLILIFDLFRAQTKKPKTFLMLKWNGSQSNKNSIDSHTTSASWTWSSHYTIIATIARLSFLTEEARYTFSIGNELLKCYYTQFCYHIFT